MVWPELTAALFFSTLPSSAPPPKAPPTIGLYSNINYDGTSGSFCRGSGTLAAAEWHQCRGKLARGVRPPGRNEPPRSDDLSLGQDFHWPPRWMNRSVPRPNGSCACSGAGCRVATGRKWDSPFLCSRTSLFTWATQVFSGRPRGKVASTPRRHTHATRKVSSPTRCTTVVLVLLLVQGRHLNTNYNFVKGTCSGVGVPPSPSASRRPQSSAGP